MQHILAWLRRNLLLSVAALTIIGILLVVLPLVMAQVAPASGEATPSQAADGAGFESSGPGLEPTAEPESEVTPAAEFIVVYISGAVRRPDVYRLPATARVKDVVLAAGGLADDADPDQINLADHIADAQHIYIRHRGEAPPAEPPSGDSQPATGERAPLNINTASAAQLDGLPGLGQVYAQRIVEYRAANGPFQAVEDLQKVKGISSAIFDKLAPLITVGP